MNSRQVIAHGQDEKRAFTLVVGVSASGVLLPFQSVWAGKTRASLPSPTGACYCEAVELNFKFEFSGKQQNYWSTEATMQSYVSDILVPDLLQQMRDLTSLCTRRLSGRLIAGRFTLRTWMASTYSWIILHYVPGGCTGLFQPCDVGIQRPL